MTAWAFDAGDQWDIPGWLRKTVAESGFGPGGFGGQTRRSAPTGGGRPGRPSSPWDALNWGGPMWGHGPLKQQRGPRAGRGDIRTAVLALLAEEPMHGYQMIQEIGRRSGGSWKPSPGSVYPTLQQLEDEGLVRAEDQEGRRVFRLTDEGQQLAAERADEFAGLWEGMAPKEDETQLGDLIFQVGAAFVHVARTGTPEQMAEARKVLARTRADLYRILGDEDATDGAEDRDSE